jgi:hypothetical protein
LARIRFATQVLFFVIRARERLYALLLMLVTITPASAVGPADDQSTRIVGIVQAPPFAIKDGNGNWDGIAVRLWRHVAEDLGPGYELREMPQPTSWRVSKMTRLQRL